MCQRCPWPEQDSPLITYRPGDTPRSDNAGLPSLYSAREKPEPPVFCRFFSCEPQGTHGNKCRDADGLALGMYPLYPKSIPRPHEAAEVAWPWRGALMLG